MEALDAANEPARGSLSWVDIDPIAEATFWEQNYARRPYFNSNIPFSELSSAYQFGEEARCRLGDCQFEVVEAQLEREWEESDLNQHLGWDRASAAVGDAWERTAARLRITSFH